MLECGTQATGGNYALFAAERPRYAAARLPAWPRSRGRLSVVTKHPGTGGAVTVGTVTAQLLYETGGARYPGPDVTARLDSVRLTQAAPTASAIDGVRGEPRRRTLKVGLNRLGGCRNEVTFVLTGLDIEAKAALVREQMAAPSATAARARCVGPSPARITRTRTSQEEASALLRLVVRDADAAAVGRAVSAPAIELALASIPASM